MGLLAAVRPTAGVETNIYTVPSGKKAVVNITISCTTSASGAVIDFGLKTISGALAAADFILNEYSITKNSPIQFTGVALAAGNVIRLKSDNGSVNVSVNGVETTV